MQISRMSHFDKFWHFLNTLPKEICLCWSMEKVHDSLLLGGGTKITIQVTTSQVWKQVIVSIQHGRFSIVWLFLLIWGVGSRNDPYLRNWASFCQSESSTEREIKNRSVEVCYRSCHVPPLSYWFCTPKFRKWKKKNYSGHRKLAIKFWRHISIWQPPWKIIA
jgi:hypothetical protein